MNNIVNYWLIPWLEKYMHCFIWIVLQTVMCKIDSWHRKQFLLLCKFNVQIHFVVKKLTIAFVMLTHLLYFSLEVVMQIHLSNNLLNTIKQFRYTRYLRIIRSSENFIFICKYSSQAVARVFNIWIFYWNWKRHIAFFIANFKFMK